MSAACKIPSPGSAQRDLFGLAAPEPARPRLNASDSARRFVTGDARSIFVGAPRLMMGLILYRVMRGIHSLRELEQLARLDLGCMWITGAIAPDHANIGRFIVMHEQLLGQDFFESLTRSILKAEAVRARAQAAGQALEAAPGDDKAQSRQQNARQCQAILEQRQAARHSRGKDSDSLCISVTELQAMVQALKRGRGVGPSYKPSVLVNEKRTITAHAVDASSQTRVIAATLERDISLLCPEGKWPARDGQQGPFHKRAFHYDEPTDSYRCPGGQSLTRLFKSAATARTRPYSEYGTNACQGCAWRAQCTQSARGRRVNRYPEDERREALRQVMRHRQARRIYSQRQAMVEPVFGAMRAQQGLSRFRRRGLQAVKREFALHALAHNLSRAVALLGALLIVLGAVFGRLGRLGKFLGRLVAFKRQGLQTRGAPGYRRAGVMC